jgi:hypothetical protein
MKKEEEDSFETLEILCRVITSQKTSGFMHVAASDSNLAELDSG